MSVRVRVAATLASRVYLAAVNLVVLPLYIRQMGLESYGLVALFFVLQVWFQLLDMGLTATMAREAARHRAGAVSAESFRRLLRAMEGLFAVIALVAGLSVSLGAELIAGHWLHMDHLPQAEVVASLRLMALSIALRLLAELYRSTVAGFERQVWLAGLNALFGTFRLVLVIPFLAWAGNAPSQFFAFQLAIAALESLVLVVQAYRLVPRSAGSRTPWRLAPIRRVLGFSVTMSVVSMVWISLSQLDKLVLAGLLPLADYGAFSLAVAAASGVMLVPGALGEVLLPRLTHLQAGGQRAAFIALYRQGTQWAGIWAWTVACMLAVHAEQVLWIWTGDAVLAARTAPVLSLYALGSAMLAAGAFPYYLQFAEGRLRLHFIGTALMLALMLPCLVWATARFGGVGAAGTWLAVNGLYLLAWTPVAHARFLPGLHTRWMATDVLLIATPAALAALAMRWLPWPAGRVEAAAALVGLSLLVLVASAGGSSWARSASRRAVAQQAG